MEWGSPPVPVLLKTARATPPAARHVSVLARAFLARL
jgi:hypothetical protein